MQIIKQSQKSINKVVLVIKNGGVVICPTDTVYGFLADAANKKAVEKIFKIKKRLRSKPLPIFVSNIKKAKEIVQISAEQEAILKKKWPGKFTFILKLKSPSLRGTAVTKQSKIAIRIPNHKFLLSLLKKINRPLVQTSVNISGQPPLNKINDIIKKFARSDRAILVIDAGNLPKSNPSTIIDLSKDKIKILRK